MAKRTAHERFWAKVDKGDGSGCWLWTGCTATSRGGKLYGLFFNGEKLEGAHRWAYRHEVGPISSGHDVDHVKTRGCVSTLCIRPQHLEAVTHRENLLRGDTFQAKNVAKTHCPRGHPYDEANTYRSNGRRRCLICRRASQKQSRAAKPKKPHARGERMGSARLTWEQVTEIRRRFQAGETNKSALAREYGVAQPTIGRVVSGKGWTESGRI